MACRWSLRAKYSIILEKAKDFPLFLRVLHATNTTAAGSRIRIRIAIAIAIVIVIVIVIALLANGAYLFLFAARTNPQEASIVEVLHHQLATNSSNSSNISRTRTRSSHSGNSNRICIINDTNWWLAAENSMLNLRKKIQHESFLLRLPTL